MLWLPQLAFWLISLDGIFLGTKGMYVKLIQRIPFLASVAESNICLLPAVTGRGNLPVQLIFAVGYSSIYGLTLWVFARGMGLSVSVLNII